MSGCCSTVLWMEYELVMALQGLFWIFGRRECYVLKAIFVAPLNHPTGFSRRLVAGTVLVRRRHGISDYDCARD